MTSPRLILIVDREGSHWVLASLRFIRRLWPHSIRLEWGKVGVTYKLLSGLGFSHLFLPHWARVYLRLISFIERILPSSLLAWLDMTLVSYWGCLSLHGVTKLTHRILILNNTSPALPSKDVSSSHSTSRSSPNSENSSCSTVTLDVQAHWKIQRSPIRVHMCYLCFCSTLAFMLLKF